jgi:hypothetical protein
MLADIVSGKTATADVFFLIALIVAVLAVPVALMETLRIPLYRALVALALAFVALGFLVL